MRIKLGRISLRSILQGLGTSRPLLIILRIALGLVFIYASLDKVVHPDQFAEIMQDYEILPNAVVNLASLWLAWLEAVLGVCLIAGVWVSGGTYGYRPYGHLYRWPFDRLHPGRWATLRLLFH